MDEINIFLPLIWIVVFVLFFIIEISTVNLVSIWYSLSALVVAVLSFFITNFYLQILIFVVIGTLFVFLTKPIVNKLKTKMDRRSDLIGVKAKVVRKIDESILFYDVVADSKNFRAYSDTKLDLNDYAFVYKIEGNTLYIRKEETL